MLRKNEIELLARLAQSGVNLDHRQSGWRMYFATFAVSDWEYGDFIGELCNEAKAKFIEAAPTLHFNSPLRSILFSPILSTCTPPKRQLAIVYQRAEQGVIVKADLNIRMWKINGERARRTAFYRALSEGMQQIRDDWLYPDQKDSLVSIFRR